MDGLETEEESTVSGIPSKGRQNVSEHIVNTASITYKSTIPSGRKMISSSVFISIIVVGCIGFVLLGVHCLLCFIPALNRRPRKRSSKILKLNILL